MSSEMRSRPYGSAGRRGLSTGPAISGGEERAASSATLDNLLVGSSAPANLYSSVSITIPNYTDSSHERTGHVLAAKKIGTATGNLHSLTGHLTWRNTAAAISRIDLLPVGGGSTGFKAGSRASLYGL